MQTYTNNYLFHTPAELKKRAFIGQSAINIILLVSLISTMGYWYVLGLEASTATGIWAIIAFSIIGLGLVTEFVKKITLSLFRHKAIWLGATFISVLTIAGTLSIIDSNKETGLIRSSDEYQLAKSRQENALNNATQYAWASGYSLNQLQNELVALTAKRERREIRYQAYLAEKRAINQKIEAKRNYDSELAMQSMAGSIMANGSNLQTSSNPLLYGVATATGAGVSFLKMAFYLAVTLLLEFSAWFLGGEVEKIKNQLTMNRAQLLDIQNMNMFGVSMQDVNSLAFEANAQLESDKQKAEKEIEKLRQNRTLPAGQIAQKVQKIRARTNTKNNLPTRNNQPTKKPQIGFINTNGKTSVESQRARYTDDSTSPCINTDKPQPTNGKAGEIIDCPECGNTFTRKTYNHRFCSTTCKDNYHNEGNEKRLKAKEANIRKLKTKA